MLSHREGSGPPLHQKEVVRASKHRETKGRSRMDGAGSLSSQHVGTRSQGKKHVPLIDSLQGPVYIKH